MRKWMDLFEKFGTTEKLYHGTNIDNLWLIMREGKLSPNWHGRDYAGPTGICLSRSFKIAMDHAGSWGETLHYSFFDYFGLANARYDFEGAVVFEFDRARIERDHEIVEYDDLGGDFEEEERVIGDLSLDALVAIYVRKGEIEEFLQHAIEAHKKNTDAAEYNDEFRAILGNVLKDPRLKFFA